MKKRFYFRDTVTNILIVASSAVTLGLFGSVALAADPAYYVKKDSWQETVLASREALMKLEQSGDTALSLPDLGESDFTISAWIKTKATGGTIVAKTPARGEWALQGKVLFLRGGAPALDVGWVGAVETDTRVNDGKWHHVALAKGDVLEFYVDGKLIETGELELGSDASGHVLKIGFCTDDFPEQSGFEGAMDEVRIYNRRLSEADIVSIKDGERNVRSGLAGWWQFEAGAADSSGSMNHGRAIRTEPTEGKFGKALRFSGSSHVVLPAWPSGCHTS